MALFSRGLAALGHGRRRFPHPVVGHFFLQTAGPPADAIPRRIPAPSPERGRAVSGEDHQGAESIRSLSQPAGIRPASGAGCAAPAAAGRTPSGRGSPRTARTRAPCPPRPGSRSPRPPPTAPTPRRGWSSAATLPRRAGFPRRRTRCAAALDLLDRGPPRRRSSQPGDAAPSRRRRRTPRRRLRASRDQADAAPADVAHARPRAR